MRIRSCLLLLLALSAQPAFAATGFRQTTIAGNSDDPDLSLSLWYPTEVTTPPIQLGETPAFVGLAVVKDAQPARGPHPLVLLSHGYGGNWRNLAWLAINLVDQGYVVAAPDHPGTTTFDMQSEDTVKLWKRPGDISRVIDALLADPTSTGGIAANRIAAIGHSLGGWTVIELAGGRFDASVATHDCMAQFGKIYCTLFPKLGFGRNAATDAALSADHRDDRVGAVVTLDLGPGRGFTPESLSSVKIPVLVLGASSDVDRETASRAAIAATNIDSIYLSRQLPTATTEFRSIEGALHFSFLQLCKPGAAARIDAETPGDGVVCRDGESSDRQAIHRQIAGLILDFLARSLPAK